MEPLNLINEEARLFAGASYPEMKPRLPIYKTVILGNPVTKKNSQQILNNTRTGRAFIAQSQKYKKYEADALRQLRRRSTIIEPVCVEVHFYRDSLRRVDLTNLLEAVDDILVKAGILQDDDFKTIVSHDGSRVFIDRKNPRTEVFIYPEEATYV